MACLVALSIPGRTLIALFTFLFGLALLIHFILLSTASLQLAWKVPMPTRQRRQTQNSPMPATSQLGVDRSDADQASARFARWIGIKR